MLDAAFAEIAGAVTAAFGGPYWPAEVLVATLPVTRGGSIVTPGTVTRLPCQAQIDTATEAMRVAPGFADGDVTFRIIGLSGPLDTDARVSVTAGPFAETWAVSQLARDPAAIGWTGKGRRA